MGKARLLGRLGLRDVRRHLPEAVLLFLVIVAAGLGLAVLPREAVGPDVHAPGLVQLPLHEPWVERRFVVCSRAESTLPATARLLMQHLREQGHMPA